MYIEIAPGTYHERVIVTQNHSNITFLGMGKSPEDVVITNSLNAKQAGGTFFTETVEINGAGFEADNITFENTAGNTVGSELSTCTGRPSANGATGTVTCTTNNWAPPNWAAS